MRRDVSKQRDVSKRNPLIYIKAREYHGELIRICSSTQAKRRQDYIQREAIWCQKLIVSDTGLYSFSSCNHTING